MMGFLFEVNFNQCVQQIKPMKKLLDVRHANLQLLSSKVNKDIILYIVNGLY